MKTKHTKDETSPRWMTGGIFMPDSDNPTCNIWGPPAPGMQSGDIILSNVPVELAERICREHNAHAELVAALEDCRKWLDGERADCKAETLEELLAAARAALEKAGRGVEGGGE